MAEYQPIFTPGMSQAHSLSATATGGQLLAVSGNGTVAPTTGATSAMVGVAGGDTSIAAQSGGRVLVFTGGVQELTAAASITAGNTLEAAANGQVTPHTNGTNDFNIVGVALTTAASGAKVRVLMAR